MKSRAGIRLRDTVQRDNLYHLALALRKEGRSYNQIIKEIESRTGITLRKSNISGWVNGKHRPFGYVRAFDRTPRSELAYVIGVALGDASMSGNRNHSHKIKLRVIDKEFCEEFSRCLSVILGRTAPGVKWHDRTHAWHTEVASLLLKNFLSQNLSLLVPTISHCDNCKSAFLRGFFDSEGSISGRSLTASNEDLRLLKLVCDLLLSLGINTTGPHLATKSGRTVMIKGKFWRQNNDLYYIRVRSSSLQRFQDAVGFFIRRKSLAVAVANAKG